MTSTDRIMLAHGGGGRLMDSLIRETILPALGANPLHELGDAAKLDLNSGRLCMTTDSYVVKPIFFPGGDIGKLSVCGTVNDLAVSGATPVALSMGLIIEEGFHIEHLKRILSNAAAAARDAGITIVAGDTKVVEKGEADEIFINTAGIGIRPPGIDLGFFRVRPGDRVLLSGTLGDHGMTIISQRQDIGFDTVLRSDCAVLSPLIMQLLKNCDGIRFMRDPTRGGLAATLNELATGANALVELDETAIPVNRSVAAAADVLGFDILEVANEGKFIAVVDPSHAEHCLELCRRHPLGKDAAIIGTIRDATDSPGVEMLTAIGGRRVVQMPYGRELPRIC